MDSSRKRNKGYVSSMLIGILVFSLGSLLIRYAQLDTQVVYTIGYVCGSLASIIIVYMELD
jgi:hypothetical protein